MQQTNILYFYKVEFINILYKIQVFRYYELLNICESNNAKWNIFWILRILFKTNHRDQQYSKLTKLFLFNRIDYNIASNIVLKLTVLIMASEEIFL